MNELEKIRIWNTLKSQINTIYDYQTKNTYYKALLARACNQWGFNPEKPGQSPTAESVELNDWEKEFIEDINDINIFGIDVRKEKREKENKEARARMMEFVAQGRNLTDIPDNICTDTIKKLYYKCLLEYGDNLIAEADNLFKKE